MEASSVLINMQVELNVVNPEQLGISRNGATTKIHWVVDANGYPIDFEITGDEVHDSQVVSQLIELFDSAEYLVADKGYDSGVIR